MNKGPEEPTGRVRQSDIARHLGINASTVSRALRNDPRITAAMRKKVLSTAKNSVTAPTRPPAHWPTIAGNQSRRNFPE